MGLHLIIGNKRYSSWSLRAWLMLRFNDLPFQEERVALYSDDYKQRLLTAHELGQVPILIDEDLSIGDSLSIAEYLAEQHPLTHGWPADRKDRARARSLCAAMHSGFMALRQECPMNVGRSPAPLQLSPACLNDVARINQLLTQCLAHTGGPYLLGDLGLVDAYYAPVLIRFDRYALLPEVSPELRAYAARMLALPEMQDWVEAGRQEPERLERAER